MPRRRTLLWLFTLVVLAGVGLVGVAWLGAPPRDHINQELCARITAGMTEAAVEQLFWRSAWLLQHPAKVQF
jgi:hypothetical protein